MMRIDDGSFSWPALNSFSRYPAIVSKRNPVCVCRFDFGYNRMTVGRGPHAIKSNGVGGSLVPAIVDFEIESTAKLVDKILQNHPALSEVGSKAAVDVFAELELDTSDRNVRSSREHSDP